MNNGHSQRNSNSSEELLCSVKQSPWDEYRTFRCPKSFKNLVRILSRLYYPNNFSINYYLQSEVVTLPISSEEDFREVKQFAEKFQENDIKLFVHIHENINRIRKCLPIIIEEEHEDITINHIHIDVNNVRYRTDNFCSYVKCL
jgi:hypothetical protein